MVSHVVQVNPDRTVIAKKLAQVNQTITHHGEPDGVFEVVLVIGEGLCGVKRRVNVDGAVAKLGQ
ncbi:hypothetical protein HMPREF3153_00360 [Corynebacterium sp. HMSC06C06]|nr:hypothetical protein HMPREF3153_00360 [Corynebacterium sp. HMSC06C06]